MHKNFLSTAVKNPFLSEIKEQLVVPAAEFFAKSSKHTLCIHVGYHNQAEQASLGTLPGSVYLDSTKFEAPPIWDKLKNPDLHNLFIKQHRIHAYDHILIYGTQGNMAACRLGLMLLYLGFRNFSILDGGLVSLYMDGYLKEDDDTKEILYPTPEPKISLQQIPIEKLSFHDEILMNAKAAYELTQKDPKLYQLVDVRSVPEHLGMISGYNYFSKKGRPKGCVYGGPIQSFTKGLKKGDFSKVIQKYWIPRKVQYMDKNLILFCGTGWRAAEAALYAVDYGLPNVGVFSGIMDWIGSGLPTITQQDK